MSDSKFGPFQLAANKLKAYAITCGVPNAAEIMLDGVLGDDWETALRAILENDSFRGHFDYVVLREVRDDPALNMNWFRFVGSIGQSFPGHFEFLKMIAARAQEEADGAKPVNNRILYNRVCDWSDDSLNSLLA